MIQEEKSKIYMCVFRFLAFFFPTRNITESHMAGQFYVLRYSGRRFIRLHEGIKRDVIRHGSRNKAHLFHSELSIRVFPVVINQDKINDR